MMRQSLLDDPREDTHQQYGDSPRNNWVTLLDEGFRIIGAKAFDGPVTDIRYAGGTYYATVDGVEHAFTRTDWSRAGRAASTTAARPGTSRRISVSPWR